MISHFGTAVILYQYVVDAAHKALFMTVIITDWMASQSCLFYNTVAVHFILWFYCFVMELCPLFFSVTDVLLIPLLGHSYVVVHCCYFDVMLVLHYHYL